MEIKYSATRLGFDTDIRWIHFSDGEYRGEVTMKDGSRKTMTKDEVEKSYKGDGDPSVWLGDKTKAVATKKVKVVDVKVDATVEPEDIKGIPQVDTIPHKVDRAVSDREFITKIIYVLRAGEFSIDVDGSEEQAKRLHRELSGKHPDMVIEKRIIQEKSEKVDEYSIVTAIIDGVAVYEGDFDSHDHALQKKEQLEKTYDRVVVSVNRVEERVLGVIK